MRHAEAEDDAFAVNGDADRYVDRPVGDLSATDFDVHSSRKQQRKMGRPMPFLVCSTFGRSNEKLQIRLDVVGGSHLRRRLTEHNFGRALWSPPVAQIDNPDCQKVTRTQQPKRYCPSRSLDCQR